MSQRPKPKPIPRATPQFPTTGHLSGVVIGLPSTLRGHDVDVNGKWDKKPYDRDRTLAEMMETLKVRDQQLAQSKEQLAQSKQQITQSNLELAASRQELQQATNDGNIARSNFQQERIVSTIAKKEYERLLKTIDHTETRVSDMALYIKCAGIVNEGHREMQLGEGVEHELTIQLTTSLRLTADSEVGTMQIELKPMAGRGLFGWDTEDKFPFALVVNDLSAELIQSQPALRNLKSCPVAEYVETGAIDQEGLLFVEIKSGAWTSEEVIRTETSIINPVQMTVWQYSIGGLYLSSAEASEKRGKEPRNRGMLEFRAILTQAAARMSTNVDFKFYGGLADEPTKETAVAMIRTSPNQNMLTKQMASRPTPPAFQGGLTAATLPHLTGAMSTLAGAQAQRLLTDAGRGASSGADAKNS